MILFQYFYKTGFYTGEGFIRDVPDGFTDKPLVKSNNFSQLNQRGPGKAAGFLLCVAQKKFEFIRSAAYMGSDSRHDYVGSQFIKSVRRYNQRGPLLSGAKVGEREGDEDDLPLFIRRHRQRLQCCSRNRMIFQPLLKEKNQPGAVSKAEATLSGVSGGFLPVISLLRILTVLMSFLITSVINLPFFIGMSSNFIAKVGDRGLEIGIITVFI